MSEQGEHFLSENWHNSLSKSGCLSEILAEMEEFKLNEEDVPRIIKFVENPKYKTSKIFSGAVDLFTHDCIHVLLGRGLLAKDEYLYPEGYKFGEEERYVFYSGVMGGSHCKTDLTEVDFTKFLQQNIMEVREELGIDSELLKCYYCAEKKLFPNSKESQRLG